MNKNEYYSTSRNFTTLDEYLLLYVASPSALVASLALISFGLYPELVKSVELAYPAHGLSFISCGIAVYEAIKHLLHKRKIQR